MPYRLTMLGVVAFWLVMSGLLVRLEVRPEKSAILDVPVSYVVRVILKNAQQSVLTLRQGDYPVGTLSLRPHTEADDRHSLDFSGNFVIDTPMMPHQRLGITGDMRMDKTLALRDFNLEATLQQPHYRATVQGDVSRGFLKYQLYQDSQLLANQPLPLEMSAIAAAILQAAGMPVDPAALPLLQNNFSAPTLTARETKIPLHGEDVDVFQLTVHESGAAVADIYVSQLGQIVMGTSTFGYSLDSMDFR